MLIELLSIAVAYAGAIAYARWVAHYRGRSGKRQRRYMLVAGNHEAQIEWYLRALRRYSRRSGTDVRMTVWLRDSSDETGSIVRQMARLDDGIDWMAMTGKPAESEKSRELTSVPMAYADGIGAVPIGIGFEDMAAGNNANEIVDEDGTEALSNAMRAGSMASGDAVELAADFVETSLVAEDVTAGLFACESGMETVGETGSAAASNEMRGAAAIGETRSAGARSGELASGVWSDTRLESVQPVWIELSKPEDVARLPI
ncbi:hypothetical protein COLU111180_03295 [Cohnella lubricantis]|uniref:Uncharacterized protein n=1 Tax=Cohnella lubricantis TaxID=2163172 RepID=A0A841TIY7_9BACL|nr:hypothetical protein [Cohnella lubricantis]MBB6679819.1 hypothetical protein [Cohnella lubricantis]MBP2118690.1 hypothetical protein [Cohnella lubricantis]